MVMIVPAVHFPGNCKEAIAFYQEVFQAAVHCMDFYRDAPSDWKFAASGDTRELVMHAELTLCGTRVNMSDMQEQAIAGNMICLNVFYESADEVCRAYELLQQGGGKVVVELGPQFFSPMYGSVVDRFGLRWQLIS